MKLKLTHKVAIAFALALAINTVVLTSISFVKVTDETQKMISSNAYNYSQLAARDIGNWLESRKLSISALTKALSNSRESEDILRHLEQTKQAAEFDLVYLGLANGDMYRNTGLNTVSEYDPRVRSWYKLASNSSDIVVTKPFIAASSGKLTVTIAKSLYIDGTFIGVVGASVSLSKLTQDVSDMDVPGEGIAFILSDDGMIIAHPNEKLRNQPYDSLNANLSFERLPSSNNQNNLPTVKLSGTNYLVTTRPIPASNWLIVMAGKEDVLLSPIRDLAMFSLLAASAMIVITIAVVTPLIKALFTNLLTVSSALKTISEGGGDLTQRIKVVSHDEVGQLAENFNLFVGKLQNLLCEVRNVTEQVNIQSRSIATAASKQEVQAKSQQDEVTMVATAVTEMASATQEIANNCEQTANASANSVLVSSKGQETAKTCQGSIESLSSQVNDATEIISQLSAHGQDINTIVSTISDIAEQTNLLALNAAIEAARAGEQGRGFAVVADEVRVLSQRTHKSTEEITAMIATLKTTTQAAVDVMAECHELAVTSVDDAQNANDAFSEIAMAICQISDMSTQIAAAAEEQTSVTDEIGRNTDAIREVADSFMTESRKGVDQSSQLSALSDKLNVLLSQFKLS
ncbi:methyl-accepting chemotaxis protein [Vibrio brasiliensis]|uniref:methyl-accepting chemotaxis protein n=1 Tax=Vibrio brasiliensis TaxID=170652 RepID=UPI001EFE68C4|nr:methyl-accepting chemotaxis protein [Vibrio brasiliensis]MCG9784628.1 methyl-accepting chemotaxis protein [Vibrio brasiliensis]